MIKAIFDLSFDELITLKLLGIVYAVTLGLIGFLFLAGAGAALFAAETALGVLMGLLFAVLAAILAVLLARVGAEAVAVFFRINENVRELRAIESGNTLRHGE